MLTLGYWKTRGRAEIPRLLLEITKQEYQNKNYTDPAEWFQQDKQSLKTDFPNLPYLIDGDEVITESVALAYYIVYRGNLSELAGKSWKEQVQVRQIVSLLDEADGFLYQGYGEPNYDQIRKENIQSKLIPKLKGLSNFLGQKQWILDYLTIADAYLFFIEEYVYFTDPNALSVYSNFLEHRERFLNIPEVAQYLKSDRFIPNWY